MRRVGLLVIGAGLGVFGLVVPAAAAPSPAAGAAGPAPETVCTLSDDRLIEISGMAALPDGGYVVENDSNDQAAAMRVTFLDSKCKPTRLVSYPAANPARDPEDLAVGSDGTVWVGDIGDNNALTNLGAKRETVALWKVPPGGGTPVIHRVTYPDRPHDAEALLLGPGDVPIIVTKELDGTALIFQPDGPLQPGSKQGVPLKNVGAWKPQRTGTPNSLGNQGQVLVTGGAQTPDRKRVALRTYSDAYDWDVPDGDVVKAITSGTPRITPLPNEPQGEAITYSPDGKSFLTCSDQTGPAKILRYQPASAVATATATDKPAQKADIRPWYKKLSLPQIINIVGGVGVLGLLLVVVGMIGIRQSRKARRNEGKPPPAPSPAGQGAAGGAPPTEVTSSVSAEPPAPAGGGVYGGGSVPGGGGVYGGASVPGGGGVYGGASVPGGGGVYGSGNAQGGASPGAGNVYGGQAQPGFDPSTHREFSHPGYQGDGYSGRQ